MWFCKKPLASIMDPGWAWIMNKIKLGKDSACDLWDAVDAADLATLDEWLRSQNDPETCTRQSAS